MRRQGPHVTDHAVLRYMERALGIDVAAVRREIARQVDVALPLPGASGIRRGALSFRLSHTDEGVVITTVKIAHRPDKRLGRKA